MKNILSLFLLLFFCSCAEDAERLVADNSLIDREEVAGINAVEGRAMDLAAGEDVRSITMLIYPNKEDLEGFSFQSAPGKDRSWNNFLNDISYRNLVKRDYVGMQPDDMAVQAIFTVLSAGESRDNAYLNKVRKEKQTQTLRDEKEALETPPAELEEALEQVKLEMEPFSVCYYKRSEKPDSDDEKYSCKTEKDDDYSRSKKARSSCIRTLQFDFIDLDQDKQVAFETMKKNCQESTDAYDDFLAGVQEKLTLLENEIEKLENEAIRLESLRDDGKSVVLDILQSAEKHLNSKSISNVALVGTASTVEQSEGPLSQISYTKDDRGLVGEQFFINELKLFLDFGNFYSTGPGAREYSVENQKITNVKYYKKNNKVIKLEFFIEADGFRIFADLSETIQDGFGIRYVGEVTAYYKNNVTRKGAIKIEINQK